MAGTHNTVNRVFHLVAFECFYTDQLCTLDNGIIGMSVVNYLGHGVVYVFTLSVSLPDYGKTTRSVFRAFGGKVAHRPRKNLLDFDDYLHHVTLGFGIAGVRVWLTFHIIPRIIPTTLGMSYLASD